jgi:hypothetical protein
MPIRIHGARGLTNLGGDERQLLIENSAYIDFDVKQIVRREFGGHSPRNDIQVLEALDDARNRAGVSVSDDFQPSPGKSKRRIHGTNAS